MSCWVEVKFGTMVFDSKLIIITSNIEPVDLARATRPDNRDAIFRRLTDTFEARRLTTPSDAREKLTKNIIKCVSSCMDVEIDNDMVMSRMPHVVPKNMISLNGKLKTTIKNNYALKGDLVYTYT